jgi:hypothetical protein
MDNLLELIIYIAIGLIGVIASAYKNKKKMPHPNEKPQFPGVPRTLTADPGKEFGPDFGPLAEFFDLPGRTTQPVDYETIEQGPSVEEAGMTVDNQEASAELAGMKMEEIADSDEKLDTVNEESFEEGQSDIQKMIAKYEAIRERLEQSETDDDIARGEIVSVEAEEASRLKSASKERFFDPKKAIIYSEILKRKEY